VALVLMILLGCEVIPKALAVRLPEKWSLAVVRPLRFMEWTARPLEKLADWMGDAINQWAPKRLRGEITRGGGDSDYQELLELGHQQGVLGQGEKEIIQEIIELDRKCATDVMTPRSQVKAIAFDMPIQDMRSEARQASFRRMPLYSESLDQIVGILDTRLLFLNPSGDLFECTELPSFVPESMNLLALFKSLQRQRRGLAVVVDEFGGLAGVVTMEDILEAILGPIRNENESEDFEFEVLASGLWRVSGLLEIEVFREHCPELGEVHEVDTMGGLFTMKLGYVPDGEETVQYGGLKLTSKVVGERRVKELLVERLSDHEDKKLTRFSTT
jgi:putative hemolysin